MRFIYLTFSPLLFLFTVFTSCNTEKTEVLGAGASFPAPFYKAVFSAYSEKTGHDFEYLSIGSSGGVRQFQSGAADIGASDAYIKDGDLAEISGQVVHIPTCIGGVAMIYNLPNFDGELRLNADIISGIYTGRLRYWDAPEIMAVNPNALLPHRQIVPVFRTDGSGTTAIFTDFLSKASDEAKEKIGVGKVISWQTGIGGKGNEGVSRVTRETPYAITYAAINFAIENKLAMASIKNKSGNFIYPDLTSVSKAADTVLPQDLRVNLTYGEQANAYPISGFTWLLLFREPKTETAKSKRNVVKDFLTFMITDGQEYAEPLNYAKLPERAVEYCKTIIEDL